MAKVGFKTETLEEKSSRNREAKALEGSSVCMMTLQKIVMGVMVETWRDSELTC